MHNAHAFLTNLTVVLCVAALTTYLFQRIKQPVVFGYLIAGMIVGPYISIPLVADKEMVATLSELGVILLMFGLGLEFSLRKLAQVGPSAGLIALIDTSAMFGFGYAVGQVLGWTTLESVFAGAMIAISSTTIIVKAFAEQGVRGRFTELVFGILIIEDLIAILLIAVLTTVSSGGGVSASALALLAGKLSLFLAAFIGIGLVVVPRVIQAVMRLNRPETSLVVSLGICFGGALLALAAGYSVALGAFIAGSLIAESGHAKTIEHQVVGVRDMFGAVFFVSVGMMIDPRLVAEHWVAVVAFSVVVIVGKLLAVTVGAFLTGNGVRTSTQAGMSLTQIGEFAFIIAAVGLTTGAIRDFLYPVAVAVSAITTLTTPLLIKASDPFAAFLDRRLPRPLQTFVGLYASWIERLRRAPVEPSARMLVRRKVRLLILDATIMAAVVIGAAVWRAELSARVAAATGITPDVSTIVIAVAAAAIALPLIVGILRVSLALSLLLATRALPQANSNRLDYAAVPRRVLVSTLHLGIVLLVGVIIVGVTEPFVPLGGSVILLGLVVTWLLLGFWRNTTDLYGHTQAGAQVMLSALARTIAPAPQSEALPAASPAVSRDLAAVHRVLPGLGDPIPFVIAHDNPVAGRTLRDLQLRTLTGAVVLAITRGEVNVLLPVGGSIVQPGDILALAGSSEAIASATALLEGRAIDAMGPGSVLAEGGVNSPDSSLH